MRYFEVELFNLRKELVQLSIINNRQGLKIDELIQENNNLVEQNKNLLQENKNLRNQLYKLQDKLNINSSNSGLPTSKDIYKLEKHKRKSELKTQAQAGHKGSSYQFQIPIKYWMYFPKKKHVVCGRVIY